MKDNEEKRLRMSRLRVYAWPKLGFASWFAFEESNVITV